MYGGPPVPTLREINAGFEAEHQAGLEAGLNGQDWTPSDDGVFSRYDDTPHGRKQMAAWSRGHAKGIVQYLAKRRQEREAAAKASPYEPYERQLAG